MDRRSFLSVALGAFARPAARILLLTQSSVLLFHAQEPATGRRFWATPGGGLHVGETFEAAAHRELLEETGLDLLPV